VNLGLELTPLDGFPALQGAQQLAWSYLLDRIFADAYHTGVGTLHLSLPSEQLVTDVELRAQLTPSLGDRTAHALLTPTSTTPVEEADTLYTLHYGRLSPFYQHKSVSRARHLLSVFTWQARVLGLPIRLLKSPSLVDRAMFAMRQQFTSERHTLAYYHLYKTLTIDSGQSSAKGLA
jgi:hypothetical protein